MGFLADFTQQFFPDKFADVVNSSSEVFSRFEHYQEKGFQHKSSALSIQARNEGNALFNHKTHDEKTHKLMLSLFTKSIALAEENSEEQALAYSSRSVFLMHIHKYKKCLIDVNRACKITQSKNLRKKLLFRKEKCLELINRKDDAENPNLEDPTELYQQYAAAFVSNINNKFSNFALDGSKQDQSQKAKPLDEIEEKFDKLKIPKLTSPHKAIPDFSDCLSLEYNEKYGRHVVATRDIKPGEILVIEKGSNNPAVDKIYLVCSYCLNFTWSGIPCPNCVFAVYCSDKCKQKAWEEYHDMECSILPPLLSEAFTEINKSYVMFALRLFLKFFKVEGLKNMIEATKDSEKKRDSHNRGFPTKNEKSYKSNYRCYLDLIDYNDCNTTRSKDEQKCTVVLALLLSQYTNVFELVKEGTKLLDLNHAFLMSNFCKMKKVVNQNAYPFQDVDANCVCLNHCSKDCPKNLGFVVSHKSIFFNHSCISNASRIFSKGGRIIIFSTRPIKKNEQLFLNYGVDLCIQKIKRQTTLKKFYDFTCTCESCSKDWNNDPEKWQPDLDIIKKITEDFNKYAERITSKNKKIDYVSLSYAIKMIELGHQYFDNNFDAYMFCQDYVSYTSNVIQKLYGVEINVPKNC